MDQNGQEVFDQEGRKARRSDYGILKEDGCASDIAEYNANPTKLFYSVALDEHFKYTTFLHQLSPHVLSLTVLSAIGGFLFGYDTGIVSGALISLRSYFNLTTVSQEIFVSATLGMAALCAIIAGVLADYIGRKPVVVISSFFFFTGSIILGFADSEFILIIGRLIVGVGVGCASMSVPVYIAECSTPQVRGFLVSVNVICITGGQFVAGVIAALLISNGSESWRYMLGAAAIPAAIQFFGMLTMPESPRWLVKQGKVVKAEQVLQLIRGSSVTQDEVSKEICKIQEAQSKDECQQVKLQGSVSCSNFTFWKMLRSKTCRRALLIGCGLQMFQQFTGINTVMYYCSSIINMSGVTNEVMVVWLAALCAFVNFLFSFVGLALIDRMGRKKLILLSLVGVLGGLIVLALGFSLTTKLSPLVNVHEVIPENFMTSDALKCNQSLTCGECTSVSYCGFCFERGNGNHDNGSSSMFGSCLLNSAHSGFSSYSSYGRCSSNSSLNTQSTNWAYQHCPTSFWWINVVGLLLYLTAFAPGMGPVPWAVNSEIYPTWARSTGSAAATFTNWSFNLIVSVSFLSLSEAITPQGSYCLFGCLVILAIIFISQLLPETKNKSLEEIEAMLS